MTNLAVALNDFKKHEELRETICQVADALLESYRRDSQRLTQKAVAPLQDGSTLSKLFYPRHFGYDGYDIPENRELLENLLLKFYDALLRGSNLGDEDGKQRTAIAVLARLPEIRERLNEAVEYLHDEINTPIYRKKEIPLEGTIQSNAFYALMRFYVANALYDAGAKNDAIALAQRTATETEILPLKDFEEFLPWIYSDPMSFLSCVKVGYLQVLDKQPNKKLRSLRHGAGNIFAGSHAASFNRVSPEVAELKEELSIPSSVESLDELTNWVFQIFGVGDTPLIAIPPEFTHGSQVYASGEWANGYGDANGFGNVKQKPALAMLLAAIYRGHLTKGRAVLESSSGNTGSGVAWFAQKLGYNTVLVIPENAVNPIGKLQSGLGAIVVGKVASSSESVFYQPEYRKVPVIPISDVDSILSRYLSGTSGPGIYILLAKADYTSDDAMNIARKIRLENPRGYAYLNQYTNSSNPGAHTITGDRIWLQTQGTIAHFASAIGTAGSLVGTGMRLKEYKEDIELWGIQPAFPDHPYSGVKSLARAGNLPRVYETNSGLLTGIILADNDYPFELAERIFGNKFPGGSSSVLALAGAVYLSEVLAEQSRYGTIVTLFPDRSTN